MRHVMFSPMLIQHSATCKFGARAGPGPDVRRRVARGNAQHSESWQDQVLNICTRIELEALVDTLHIPNGDIFGIREICQINVADVGQLFHSTVGQSVPATVKVK